MSVQRGQTGGEGAPRATGGEVRLPIVLRIEELFTRTSRVQNSAANVASGSNYTRVGAKSAYFSRIYEDIWQFPSDWNS